MKISSVSNTNAFKGAQETYAVTSPNEKKDIKEVLQDNKGKIALGLSALAAVGIAAVAISRGKKVSVPNVSSEVPPEILSEVPSKLSIDDFKKIGKFDKGSATVNGKPFSGIIDVTNKRGNYALEYADGALKSSTFSKSGKLLDKKVYSEQDGIKIIERFYYPDPHYQLRPDEPTYQFRQGQIEFFGGTPVGCKTMITDNKIITERTSSTGEILQDIAEKQQDGSWKKTFQNREFDREYKHPKFVRSYIETKDEAGNVIAKNNPIYKRWDEVAPHSNEPVLRQSKKYINDDGNEVVETYVNNHIHAVKTTKLHDDGSKQIIVKYPYIDMIMMDDVTKTIDIAKDGTKKVSVAGRDLV